MKRLGRTAAGFAAAGRVAFWAGHIVAGMGPRASPRPTDDVPRRASRAAMGGSVLGGGYLLLRLARRSWCPTTI